jgi:hypothetical protein
MIYAVLDAGKPNWDQDRHRHRTRAAGFDRNMTKPADPAALRAVLNDADMR